MTCIVGYVQDGEGWFGADSYTETGGIRHSNTSKAWRVMDGRGGYLLLGISGRSAFRTLVKNVVQIPISGTQTVESYILYDLPAELKVAALASNDALLENNIAALPDNDLMVVYRGNIYYMDSYFYMRVLERPHHAIGSGAAAAMGAMFVISEDTGNSPDEKLQLALLAAENVNTYVSSPFQILRDR